MRDKFEFSNAQALGALDSTGVVSTNYWDLEENAVADGQVFGWLNGIILASTNSSGTEGLIIELRSDDTTTIAHAHATADERVLGMMHLKAAEIAAGVRFCFGVCKAVLGRYVGIWYRAHTTSLNNATSVDVWFSEHPITNLGLQKKPA